MSRRLADPVEVRTTAAPAGPVPDQFLWNGRLYVVREVLARWTESGSWWRGTAVRALLAGNATTTEPPVKPGRAGIDDRETQWWRVEADSGRLAVMSAGTGVYDLCFEESTTSWSLKRVMD